MLKGIKDGDFLGRYPCSACEADIYAVDLKYENVGKVLQVVVLHESYCEALEQHITNEKYWQGQTSMRSSGMSDVDKATA